MELLEVSVSVKPLPINEGGFEMDLVSVPRRLGSEGITGDCPATIVGAFKVRDDDILRPPGKARGNDGKCQETKIVDQPAHFYQLLDFSIRHCFII